MQRTYSLREALEAVQQPAPVEPEDEQDEDILSTSSEETSESEAFSEDLDENGSTTDEDELEEDESADEEAAWFSKNEKISWASTNEDTLRYVPRDILRPGPTLYAISRINSPESAFKLFITEEEIHCILKYTNLQGMRSLKSWKSLDETELWAYLGLLLLSGVYKSRNEDTRNLWDNETGRPVFPATMPRNRFLQITSALRFDDRLTRAQRDRRDRLAPIRELWYLWSEKLPQLYNLGRDVCVDEQLVAFRGRCSFKQYMKSKSARYGIKIWAIADVATSYAWRLQIYTGRSPGQPKERNQGMRVVLELTSGLEGYTITTDNFFTSFNLADELLRRRCVLVGTIKKNKPELPVQLLQKGRAPHSSLFAFRRTQTVVSYVPKEKKSVLLLSTKHREPEVNEQDPKKRPQIILDYNRCKGGVDNLDKVLGTYSCRRKTRRWPLIVFFHMLDVSAYNSFVLHQDVDPSYHVKKSFKRRLFLEELGKSLIQPHMTRRKYLPRSAFATSIVQEAQTSSGQPAPRASLEGALEEDPGEGTSRKRRQCFLCEKRCRVWTVCLRCHNHVCKEHQQVVCSSCYSSHV